MKKVSNVLLLIGAILSFISVFALIIVGIVMFVFASPMMKDLIIEGINNGSIQSSFTGDAETVAASVQQLFLIVGIVMLVISLPTIIVAIISLVARKKMTNGLMITVIVLAIISGELINLAGGILGLVANSAESK